MGVAVFCIYAVDFAVNGGEFEPFLFFSLGFWGWRGKGGWKRDVGLMMRIVQATARSLIVDTLPVEQQQLGSAWGELLQFEYLLVDILGLWIWLECAD